MVARWIKAGRFSKRGMLAAATLATALVSLLLTTELPAHLASVGGGSVALAELIERSPGIRVGGIALKAKKRRAYLAPAAKPAAKPGAPRTAMAHVLGAAVPQGLTVPDTATPAFPLGTAPSPVATTVTPVPITLGPGTGAIGSTPPIIIGGGGGSPPGGGGGGGPPGTTTPPGGGTVVTPPPPAVPEPTTWMMVILGFGMVGGAMRRRRSLATA